jgi:hypothetical protein
MSEEVFNPLDLLGKDEKSEQLRRNISTAALLWAASSVVAFILRLKWPSLEYKDALPAIVLITWFGSEIVARIPRRIPISVCAQCGRMGALPNQPLRRLWPWRHCVYCGGALRFSCPNNHLLSLFSDEPLAIEFKAKGSSAIKHLSIWCSRCGEASRALTAEESTKYSQFLYSYTPKADDFYKLMVSLAKKWASTKHQKPVTLDEYTKYLRLFLDQAPEKIDDYKLLNFVLRRHDSDGRTVYDEGKLGIVFQAIIPDESELKRTLEPVIREFRRVKELPYDKLPRCPECSEKLGFFSTVDCRNCRYGWRPFYTQGFCPKCHLFCETIHCSKCDKTTPFINWQIAPQESR